MDPGCILPGAIAASGGYEITIYETLCLVFFSLTAAWSSLLSGAFSVYSSSELDELIYAFNGDRDRVRTRIDRDLSDIEILQFSSSATSTLSLFLTAIFAYRQIVSHFGSNDTIGIALFVSLAVILPIVLLVVQIIPKIIAFTYAERILLSWSTLARLSLTPMLFVGKLARRFDRVRSRLAGEEIRPEKEELEDDLIGQIREGERDGWIDSDEAKMARAVFKLKEKDAASEMTPRTDIVMAPSDSSVRAALTISNESGHSRLPVFQDTRDNIVGVFYVKDAVASLIAGNDIDKQQVTEIMRPPFFVPDTKRLDGLLEKMQQNKTHTAVILDEYGGTAGLITLEDIFEEVIGAVEDESDADEPPDY